MTDVIDIHEPTVSPPLDEEGRHYVADMGEEPVSDLAWRPDGLPSQLPSSIEAEQALLGAILYDNGAYERVGDYLKPGHFYEPFHARLFGAMEGLIRKSQLAEPIVLMERFKRDAAFEELGGIRYLADLVDRAPPAANAADYARLIHDLALRRELIRIGGDIAKGAAEDSETPAKAMIEGAEQQLYGLAELGAATTGDVTFAEALTRGMEAAAAAYSRDGALSGLSTGLTDLDRLLGGLHPSDLVILAGRPSMGKSALAANIAFHAARHYAYEQRPDGSYRTVAGGIVQFFSLEMSADQLAMRLLAEASGISSDRVRKGKIDAGEYGQLRDSVLEIQDAPLFIDATGGLSIAQLCARARRRKRLSGLDLIVVDYLQLVSASNTSRGSNRVNEVTEITMALKALAKDLNVPVLALSQLSRKVEEREDKKPQLSDLRESGSIEQDADVVGFIYREAYYKSRAEPKANSPEYAAWLEEMDDCRHEAEVIIGKQRHGPIGTVKLHFNEDLTKFSNLARPDRFGDEPSPSGGLRVVYSGVRGG